MSLKPDEKSPTNDVSLPQDRTHLDLIQDLNDDFDTAIDGDLAKNRQIVREVYERRNHGG